MVSELDIDQIPGDGGEGRVPDDLLSGLKEEVRAIASDAAYIYQLRQNHEDTRYCFWQGQSDDGRKHEADQGKKPFPFENASDGRIRVVDQAINEKAALFVTAAMRAIVKARGVESTDEGPALKAETLIRWVIQNQLGAAYRRELKKLANYYLGDAPSAGVMGVFWQQESALEMREVTLDGILDMLAQQSGQAPDPMDVAEIGDLFTNPARAAEAEPALRGLFPQMTTKRARIAAKELREAGRAEFPSAYVRVNLPAVKAMRVYEDVFFPPNTVGDIQRARCVFVREWLTRAECQEKVVSDGWSEAFVAEVCGTGADGDKGREGQTAFPWAQRLGTAISTDPLRLTREQDFAGLYEIITAYFRATNDDGVPGIFCIKFHADVDQPAKDRELLEYQHGFYPFVYFQRELLNNSLLDSRSLAEVGHTWQYTLKLLHDTYNDRTMLETVPPLEVPDYAVDGAVVIAPLAENKRRRQGDLKFMDFPARPISNEVQQTEVRRQFNEYFGRPAEGVPEAIVQIIQQDEVDQWLDFLKDGLMQLFQLCQQFMTDLQVQRITGGNGMPIARTRAEIQGKFDILLTFDVRDLNMEYLLKKAKLIMENVLPLDTGQTIARDRLVKQLFMAIDPVLAETVVLPQVVADQREVDDEQGNIAKMMTGVEPPMMEDGQNFELRLQVLESAPGQNPALLQRLVQNPDSLAMYQARLKHLRFQQQQNRNKIIGRVGAKPALDQGVAA